METNRSLLQQLESGKLVLYLAPGNRRVPRPRQVSFEGFAEACFPVPDGRAWLSGVDKRSLVTFREDAYRTLDLGASPFVDVLQRKVSWSELSDARNSTRTEMWRTSNGW